MHSSEIRKHFASVVSNGSFGCGYLFISPDEKLAREVAMQIINDYACTSRKDNNYFCGQCKDCIDLKKHPELILYDVLKYSSEKKKEQKIGIDDIRALKKQLTYSLRSGKYFVLIDKGEAITREAESAILKILEEPPKGVIFFIIASTDELISDTIKSRVAIYRIYDSNATINEKKLFDFFNLNLHEQFTEVKRISETKEEAVQFITRAIIYFDHKLNKEVENSSHVVERILNTANCLKDALRALSLINNSHVNTRLVLEGFLSGCRSNEGRVSD